MRIQTDCSAKITKIRAYGLSGERVAATLRVIESRAWHEAHLLSFVLFCALLWPIEMLYLG